MGLLQKDGGKYVLLWKVVMRERLSSTSVSAAVRRQCKAERVGMNSTRGTTRSNITENWREFLINKEICTGAIDTTKRSCTAT